MKSALRSSSASAAMAWAAAIFISGVMRRAPASSAPRKMPGNASTLLIWFGKSERPVATTAAYLAATSGRTSGSGLESAKMMASSFIPARSSSATFEEETPTRTSAPSSAWRMPPMMSFLLVLAAYFALMAFRSSRSRLMVPRESTSTTSPTPALTRISAIAMPAAPAPLTTTRRSPNARPVTFAALVRAARTTTAVPCWSSCITGQSSASIRRSSSSKQRGAAMSSRFTAP